VKKYDCRKLMNEIVMLKFFKQDFDALFIRGSMRQLQYSKEAILRAIKEVYTFAYWRKFECLGKIESNLTVENGDLGVSLTADQKSLVYLKTWHSFEVITFDEMKPEININGQTLDFGQDSDFRTFRQSAPIISMIDHDGNQWLVGFARSDRKNIYRLFKENFDGKYQNNFQHEVDFVVSTLVASPKETGRLILGTDDGQIGLLVNHELDAFDPNGEEILGEVHDINFLPDNRFFLSVHADYEIYLWDYQERKLVRKLPIQASKTAVNPVKPGEIYFSSGQDIRVYDLETDLVHQLTDDLAIAGALICDSKGRFLLAGDPGTGGVRVYDIETGERVKELKGGQLGYVESLLFSKEGYIVSATKHGLSVFGRKKAEKKAGSL